MSTQPCIGDRVVIAREGLQQLFDALRRRGFRLVGPTISDGAIVFAPIASVADLPAGWGDEQEGGTYRLRRRDDGALFGFASGPHSWKHFLHPPRVRLAPGRLAAQSLLPVAGQEARTAEPAPPPRYAFIGVRSCDLHAIVIQDRVFTGGTCVDTHYRSRREGAFLVAVNCGEPSATCFCVSMGTGPEADGGYDLVLTEILEEGIHHFVAAAGSEEGAAVLGELETSPAGEEARESVRRVVDRSRSRMGRTLDTAGLKELLYRNFDHPRWDDAARRCLSCGNCTNVCPTCFCTTVEDRADLEGATFERSRRWDSCFTLDFSHIHGGSVRSTVRARYRQWMTHKLATWWDQFGTSGCVGCGRCITWCPVGIDITAEADAIRRADGEGRSSPPAKETGHGNQVA